MAFLSMLCCGKGTDRYVYEVIMLIYFVGFVLLKYSIGLMVSIIQA